MIDPTLNYANIPADAVPIKAHSNFGNQIGYYHFITKNEGDQERYHLGLQLNDSHGGAPGRGHGGVTMTMLDEVMGRAASQRMRKLCYTASMTTNFCAGTQIGEFLLATATISRCGANLVFVDAQLHSNDKLIATATGTWASSGLPIPEFPSMQ